MQIARVLHPVTALGPGRRVGVWVQGCTLACPGCASTDTWDGTAGTTVSVTDLAALVAHLFAADPSLTGLTITGGEPLQQATELATLLVALRAEWLTAGAEIDVLLFTGYAARTARVLAPQLLGLADVVVSGPYRAHHGHGGGILGSSNQEVVVRTTLGHRRMSHLSEAQPLQVTISGSDITMIGLPRPGDLDRLRTELSAVGIDLAAVSWQP